MSLKQPSGQFEVWPSSDADIVTHEGYADRRRQVYGHYLGHMPTEELEVDISGAIEQDQGCKLTINQLPLSKSGEATIVSSSD